MALLQFPTGRAVAPIPEALRNLAPLDLPNLRQQRYQGDDLHVPLTDFAAQDQESLRHLYDAFNTLLGRMVDPATGEDRKWGDVRAWIAENDLNRLIGLVREMGQETEAHAHGEMLAKTLHDVRGGALSALLGRLQLIDRLPQTEGHMKMLFALTRDHLKIMRSAITGLDEARRDSDRTPRSHNVKLILDKWQDSIVGPYPPKDSRPVRMVVDTRYEGALTECCLESAAVDRIFYNLANNACRHSAGDTIEMVIFEVPQTPGDTLRIVLSNEVSAGDAARLREFAAREDGGGDGSDPTDEAENGVYLDGLFAPAVSSTGSGYGLTVVADFVAGAFGLRNSAEAVQRRYTGARLDGNTFRVFLHWPTASDALPPKTDDYHRPQESLSDGMDNLPDPGR